MLQAHGGAQAELLSKLQGNDRDNCFLIDDHRLKNEVMIEIIVF